MNTPGAIFEACAFNPILGNESIAGRIVVERWVFRFESETVVMEVPFNRLHVRVGEGTDERLYFQDVAQPEWEIITADFSILEQPAIAIIDGIGARLNAEASRNELWRRLRLLGYVLGVGILLVWLSQVALSLMVRSLVAKLPPELEQEIGDAMIVEVQEEMEFIEDTNRVGNLVALAAPLTTNLAGGKMQFTFYIAEDDDPNAFALPGGHVIVTTGLLKMADRPEQVLGVLAHEVAHVTEKHGVRKVIASVGPFLIFRVFLGGNSRGLAQVAGGASDLIVRQSFSQEYETEADEVGWRTLVAAKIDPRGMTEMFGKLAAYERAQEIPGYEMPAAFQSHPALNKRIARLEKKWNKLSEKGDFMDVTGLQKNLKTAGGP